MNKGELADSDLVMRLMLDQYKTLSSDILLLDGFPRKGEELLLWIESTSVPRLVVYWIASMN